MSELECSHKCEDTERMEIIKPDEPYLCDMCAEEADIGIKYKTKLGRIALCSSCLRVLQLVAQDFVTEAGEA